MTNLKYIFSIFFSAFFLTVFSQTLKCDSVVLYLEGYQGGTIQWQSSADETTWTDVSGEDTVNITVPYSNTLTYRAVVIDGSCDPVISSPISNFTPPAFTQPEIDTINNGDENTFMRVMNIYLQPDSAILRSVSLPIMPCDTTTLTHLMNRMYKTVRNPAHPGVGIAAPQVGINRRAFWIQRYDKLPANNPPFEFYINPRIIAHSDTTFLDPDGCLSVPTGSGYPVLVTKTYRWIWVLVEYNLIDGTFICEKIVHPYTSHIFQHEYDHLDGTMYFDHSGSKNLRIVVHGYTETVK
ncbi:MAG: hypothetical protein A2309_09305 [Bacteroidetes bacterium RIFOXYB2_FULL_35_7]|nr:MAG: hypothetical protein A2309_09305 [Bacteroidetes bacterium RIFOXYB2_FULL_35_7]